MLTNVAKYRLQMQLIVEKMSRGERTGFYYWEKFTGTTSKYFKRKNGSDHLIVSNIGGWLWGDFKFLQRAKTLHVTLELPLDFVNDELLQRVIVAPYPSENIPFVPLRDSYSKLLIQ